MSATVALPVPTQATTAAAVRPDDMFGVCARLGEDFGFNPLWLRLALGCALIVNLEATLLAYATLGVFVAASRLLFPVRKPGRAAAAAPAATEADTDRFAEEVEFKKAA